MKTQNEQSHKWIACDVCDTLFYSNTTFDFVRFVMDRDGGFKKMFFLLLLNNKSPLFYLFEAISLFLGRDYTKTVALLFLKGLSQQKMDKLANLFYDDFLTNRKINTVFRSIEDNGVGCNLILVSSSLNPIVSVIASRLNTKYFIASEPEYKKGKLTGFLVKELKGNKHIALAAFLPMMGVDELVVITDNRSDVELVKMAQHRFIVIRNEREKEFWRSLNPHYISK